MTVRVTFRPLYWRLDHDYYFTGVPKDRKDRYGKGTTPIGVAIYGRTELLTIQEARDLARELLEKAAWAEGEKARDRALERKLARLRRKSEGSP